MYMLQLDEFEFLFPFVVSSSLPNPNAMLHQQIICFNWYIPLSKEVLMLIMREPGI